MLSLQHLPTRGRDMRAVLLLEFVLVVCLLQAGRGLCQNLPIFSVHPQGSVVKSGASYTLTCDTGNLSDLIQWYLSGQQIEGETSGSLGITSFASEDDGSYSCLATRTTESDSFVVTSAEAYIGLASITSSFDGLDDEVEVHSGGYADITCIPEYTSIPAPSFTWYYIPLSGIPVAGLSPDNSPTYGPDGSLVLRNVTKVQTYPCVADNAVSGLDISYETTVTLSGTFVSPVVMISEPQNALVNQEETVKLYCIATDKVSVTWTFNGEEITDGVDGKFIEQGTTSLVINPVLSSSAGTYICTHPSLGDYSATVSIRNPPSISNSPGAETPVDYGTLLTLDCATIESDVEFKWYHNGNYMDIDNTQIITIPDVTFTTGGTYQCYAYNAAGYDNFATFVTITVETPLILSPLPEKQVAFLGDSLSLQCEASGIPPPTYSWFFNGAPNDEADGSTLALGALDSSRGGTYTCEASNIVDSVIITTQVFIIASTVVEISPSNVKVYIGQPFSLQCTEMHDSAVASVELTWFFNDEEVSFTGSKTLIQEEGSRTLVVENAIESDAGEYYCHAVTVFTADPSASTPSKMALSSVIVTLSPVAPVVTVLSELSSSMIEVSWSYAGVVNNLKSFVVETNEVSLNNSNWTQQVEVSSKGETRKTLSGLTPYTEYEVRVGAVPNDGSPTTYSNVTATPSVMTLEDIPGAPTQVSANSLENGTSIAVYWQALGPPHSNGIITGYTVRYFQTGMSDSKHSHLVSSSDTTYIITDLTPDTEYMIDVAAHTSIGMGPFSEPILARTKSTEVINTPVTRKIWFIALMAAIVVILLVLFVLIMICARWKRSKGGKYPVSPTEQLATDGGVPMTEDTFKDYDKRKKDVVMTAFDGADSDLDGSAATFPTTVSNFASLHVRTNMPVPPSYINPPSFEDTLRAKSHSMSVIDKAPHLQYESGWSMGHEKPGVPDQYDEESIDKQAMLGAESGSSEDSGMISQGHSASTHNFATFV